MKRWLEEEKEKEEQSRAGTGKVPSLPSPLRIKHRLHQELHHYLEQAV